MNLCFHKVYWGGWICFHNRRKKLLWSAAKGSQLSRIGLLWGLGLLGFSSLYREGFEVVLFLQSYHLRMGNGPVLCGALIGSFLAGIVAVLTFFAHRRLADCKKLLLPRSNAGFVVLLLVSEP